MSSPAGSDFEGFVQRLQMLGMEEDEARTYVMLRLHGPSRASQIAEAAKIPRQQAYRTLDQLVRLGFATTTLTRPTLYEAVQPDMLFERLTHAAEERLNRVRQSARDMKQWFESLERRAPPQSPSTHFNVIEGRKEFVEFAAQLHMGAQKSLALYFPHPQAAQVLVQSGTFERFNRRAAEGVEARLVGPLEQDFKTVACQAKPHPRFEMRAVPADSNVSFLVVDEFAALLNAGTDLFDRGASSQRVAIFTDAPGIVRVLSDYFQQAWSGARLLDVERQAFADALRRDA